MRITEPYIIFPRTLKSGKTVFYYQYRDSAGRRSGMKSTGCSTSAQAKRFCQKIFNTTGFENVNSHNFKMFATNFFSKDNEWYKWKTANGQQVKDVTLLSYEKLLNYQVLPFFAEMKIESITASTVKNWIVWMTDRWSAKTSNNAQSVLNIILKSAYEKRLINYLPTLNLTFRKISKKNRCLLTVNELHDIYNSPLWNTSQQKLAFLIASITGMRIGEIIALQKTDIEENCFNVRHSYSSKFGLGSTKTKINRYVPIPKDLQLNISNNQQWLLQSNVNSDKPITAHSVYMTFRKICESIGINTEERGITIHSLRNFFISYLQGENIPLQKIKAVVGHKDVDITDWYTYWKPDMFPEVYKAQQELFSMITGAKT